MNLIHCALAPGSELKIEDQVTLAVERRQFLKRRWRGFAEDGIEFGFDLESRLSDGAVIFHQQGKDYVVRQLPETVYRIEVSTAPLAALVGWKVGNLHLPMQIVDDAVLVLHDESMTKLLEREGWVYSEPELVFTPMKAMAHGN
jgi:urease accessory protein